MKMNSSILQLFHAYRQMDKSDMHSTGLQMYLKRFHEQQMLY
jgi:hypothetical protein